MTEIIIAGFPKSGNTWLTRLLSDALDYPVMGIDDAIPLSAERQERHGAGLIRQLHLAPIHSSEPRFVASRYSLNVDQHDGEKVIHLYRDPRDVAVSVGAYWELGDMPRVVREVVATGSRPLWGTGWPEYMMKWRTTDMPHIDSRYEWLHDDTALEIRRLCDWMGLRIAKPLDEVIRRNMLETKREAIKATADSASHLPHGKHAQLMLLRAGRVGDWRTVFNEAACTAAHDCFDDWLIELGYEANRDWCN